MKLQTWSYCAAVLLCCLVWGEEVYREDGLVEWVQKGKLLVHLRFYQETNATQHTAFFPTPISDLVQRSPFEQLQLHLTRGRWDRSERRPPDVSIHPTGAELEVAWPDTEAKEGRKGIANGAHSRVWSDLTHRLSGLLCSSLNLLGAPDVVAHRTHPLLQMQQLSEGKRPVYRQYAALPRESICTENLTPWLKLLPCRDAAGLATLLLDRKQLFGGGYHSLSTIVTTSRDELGRVQRVQLTQTATAVLHVPSGFSGKIPTLASFFPNSLARVCPAAASSILYLRRGQEVGSREKQLQDAALREKPSEVGGQAWPNKPKHYASHDLMHMAMQPQGGLAGLLDQAWLPEMQDGFQAVGTYVPAVSARRMLLGSGTFKGHYSLQVDLGSYAGDGALTSNARLLCVYQTIPWFVRLWVHTLVVMLDDKVIQPYQMAYHSLQPSVDRVSPLVLEFCLEVPAGSQSVSITADFTKLFLTVFEHPPDAHRGFDIPSAIVSFRSDEPCQGSNAFVHDAPCMHEVGWFLCSQKCEERGEAPT
uniref:Uncharacterized protein n=1 Tax=Dunaliella tertiolecta TaxID=3047 RepID=A0A7S3QP29_DUNTE